jgi:hypothetical protein
MTKNINSMKRHIGFLGVVAAMAIAPLAHADYQIAYNIGGGPTMCLDNSDSTNLSGTTSCSLLTGSILLKNLTGTSNSPGTASLADEFSVSGEVDNNNTSGSVTINIWYAAQGFTMPVTGGGISGIKYVSNSSGTAINVSAVDTLSLESCVDESATGGVGANFCKTSAAILNNPTLTYPTGAGGAVSNSVNTGFSPLTATYSLEQEITIVLAAGDKVNFSMSQALTPVPEPMSVALLGGVLLLTSRAIQRRRKKQNNIAA